MRKKAFTLIELVIVIAILSVLAALVVPRFANIQKEAVLKQEDAIITAFKEAVNQKHMFNITSGLGDVWPGDTGNPFPNNTPFDLLSNPPPNSAWFYPEDNIRWRTTPYLDYWFILCPHRNGTGPDSGDVTKGSTWMYRFGNWSSNPYNMYPGEIKLKAFLPH